MSKPQIKEYNCETGEEIVRDATTAEIEQIEIDASNAVTRKIEEEAKAAQKSALLDKLGINEDEARLLLS